MKSNTKFILLSILGIIIVIIATFGLTYAFMRPKEKNENETDIDIKACAKIVFEETDGTTINLENTYPMDEEKGLETKPYEFDISSTCEEYVGFNLYLTSLVTSELTDDAIHFAVTSENGNVLASDVLTNTTDGSADFDEEELSQLEKGIKGEIRNIHKVFSNNISKNVKSHYKLYLWVDKAVEASETMNKTFTVGVSVKSFKREESMAEYLIKNKDDTLIYHDGKADYDDMENVELEAGDNNYRYSGNYNLVKNWVCFASDDENCPLTNLYRILGIYNGNIKLIKADYSSISELGDKGSYKSDYMSGRNYYRGILPESVTIASLYWNNDTKIYNWEESNLNKINLNDFYLNTYLPSKWKNMITDGLWNIGKNEVITSNVKNFYDAETTNKYVANKIGIMSASDYGYAANSTCWNKSLQQYSTCNDDNWLYLGLWEWTITCVKNKSNDCLRFNDIGNLAESDLLDMGMAGIIRPSFYLKNNVKYVKGEGSQSNPYRITI